MKKLFLGIVLSVSIEGLFTQENIINKNNKLNIL